MNWGKRLRLEPPCDVARVDLSLPKDEARSWSEELGWGPSTENVNWRAGELGNWELGTGKLGTGNWELT